MKNCQQCSTAFEVTDADRQFYEKISPVFGGKKVLIPEPTLCPDCRLQQRTAWRNERFLYSRACEKCHKDVISIYSPESRIPIYCNKCWWSDSWDALDYGRDFDFNRPFFEQLRELMETVPQLAIQNDDGVGSQNCQYCQDFAYGKNCYFVIGSWYTEDSFYCNINASYNRNICDCTNISRSELSYECADSENLYHCAFLQNSENCRDCFFGFDLKGCKNCFGCVGLRQKEYHFFNQPLNPEEYQKKIDHCFAGSHEMLEKIKAEYFQWVLKFPHKAMNLQNCENCEGNNLHNSRETVGFSLLNADHARFCHQGDLNKFSYDIFNSGRPEWCYEGMTPDDSYMTHFSWFSWKNKNLLYGINCHSSESLFGCVSLHRKKHCILNKQYSKEEYEALMPKILEHLQTTKEWGEFPSPTISFFGYNETVAQEYFPLTQKEVLAKGWRWKESDPRQYQSQTITLPDNIQKIKDDIGEEILACMDCKKNYKVIPQELRFYRKMVLPLPRLCPDCRHTKRIKRRSPYKLWERACFKCGQSIKSVYEPDKPPDNVLCENCYSKTIY